MFLAADRERKKLFLVKGRVRDRDRFATHPFLTTSALLSSADGVKNGVRKQIAKGQVTSRVGERSTAPPFLYLRSQRLRSTGTRLKFGRSTVSEIIY